MTDFQLVADLPDDGEQEREVYARAGLALYQAQVWERAMVNLALATRQRANRYLSIDDWDGDEAALSSLTAGRLRGELLRDGYVDAQMIGRWRTTLEARNHLVHAFFYGHAADFMTVKGRQRMADNLDTLRDRFQSSDEEATAVYRALLHDLNVDESDITLERDRLLNQVRRSDEAT